MTTETFLYGTGLTISVYTPFVVGMDYVANYTTEVDSYTHIISANGGFTSASFKISGNNIFIEDWLQNGIGRHIVVYGSSGQVVWEGFVNEFTVNMGNVTYAKGPLMNVANRVSVTYTPIIDQPDGTTVTGVTTETIITENEDSQQRYGIWEKVVNGGEVYDEDAEYIRDLYLEENAYPEGNPSISIGDNAGDVSVTINCLGYVNWISNYVYNNFNWGWSICSEVVKSILGDDPNSIISTQYDRIEENLVIRNILEEENRLAKTIIDEVISLGGGSDDRWTFGVYANRKVVYAPIPTEIEYLYYRNENTQEVQDINGPVLKPWDVLPCKWVAIPDFLSGFNFKADDFRNDPRVFFSEEVTFTAPDKINISGAKIRKLTQYMTKLGLGGE